MTYCRVSSCSNEIEGRTEQALEAAKSCESDCLPLMRSTCAEPAPDRIQFETLLADVSARLTTVESDRIGKVILEALDAVRLFFRADRCALCAVSDNLQTVHFSHISYAEGVSNILGDLDLALLFPWVKSRVVVDRAPLSMSHLDDLPPEAAVDRASFEARGTKSLLCIPIEGGPKRRHLILLSVVREECEWPEEYVPRLRLFGEVLVNTLERSLEADRACEQAARVAAAVDAAELGFAEWTVGKEQPYLDSRLRDLLGIGAQHLTKTGEIWAARTDAGSRAAVAENRRRVQTGEIERATIEYRYDHPLRGPIWLRHSSRRVEAELGHERRIIDAVEDVTERRQALEDVQRLRERLERENVYLRQEATQSLGPQVIVGRGAAIRRTLTLAEQVAATDSTVLLIGETGTGKERFADYIHECSRRRDRHMIKVNCSAIPSALIESELFGREKGAYTGALSKQVGRFELAHGATLFLDEIAELAVEMQVKLLRALEEHTIERLGNPRPIPVDVRIIAATNRNLSNAVRDGSFREDLYYRLMVFPITIPPLRERREDIPLLTQAFVNEFAGLMGKRIEKVDAACMEAVVAYSWPGNVRELRNVIERAMILTSGPTLRIDLPEIDAGKPGAATELATIERLHILKVLNETSWRIRGANGAAARLGLPPTTLESRLKKLRITRPTRSQLP